MNEALTMDDLQLYATKPSDNENSECRMVLNYLKNNFVWQNHRITFANGYNAENKLCVFVSVDHEHVEHCQEMLQKLRSEQHWTIPVVAIEIHRDLVFQTKNCIKQTCRNYY